MLKHALEGQLHLRNPSFCATNSMRFKYYKWLIVRQASMNANGASYDSALSTTGPRQVKEPILLQTLSRETVMQQTRRGQIVRQIRPYCLLIKDMQVNNLITKYSDPSLLEAIQQEQAEILFEQSLKTFKEAQILRKTTKQQKMALLQQQFQQKHKQELMNQQIRKGKVTNQQRMRKISLRNKLCNDIFLEVKKQIQLNLRSDPNTYKLFLIGIITEGILRMFEDKLLIRCLPEDESIVEGILEDCVESFHSIMNYQLGRQYELQIKIDRSNPLKHLPRHKAFLDKEQEMVYAIGGVILTSTDGNIAYKNTIDCRLNILREMALPDIRAEIWQQWKEEQSTEENASYY